MLIFLICLDLNQLGEELQYLFAAIGAFYIFSVNIYLELN